jgi:hypothetical protein
LTTVRRHLLALDEALTHLRAHTGQDADQAERSIGSVRTASPMT